MLRVGLTGDIGSGKSTVAQLLAARGAVVLSSDDMGRAMMQPGEPVYHAIVEHFGPEVVSADGTLDRKELARLAFTERRVEELNAIVHPAVIAEQARRIAELSVTQPNAIVVIESALLFTTKHTGDGESWRTRFDEVIVVTAPEAAKVARFVARASGDEKLSPAEKKALEADAQQRLAAQRGAPDEDAILVRNQGDLKTLEARVADVWRALERMASRNAPSSV